MERTEESNQCPLNRTCLDGWGTGLDERWGMKSCTAWHSQPHAGTPSVMYRPTAELGPTRLIFMAEEDHRGLAHEEDSRKGLQGNPTHQYGDMLSSTNILLDILGCRWPRSCRSNILIKDWAYARGTVDQRAERALQTTDKALSRPLFVYLLAYCSLVLFSDLSYCLVLNKVILLVLKKKKKATGEKDLKIWS